MLLTCLCFGAPWEAPSPAVLDIPYSADNPPGPSFTAEQKQQQTEAGAKILAGIREAFQAGRDSFVIPPGDYRFESAYRDFSDRSFALRDLHRDAAKPFRILGHGATFWFNLSPWSAPHYHQMIKLADCSNLSLEGLTVDSDPRGSMDARIVSFDFEGNRIQVRPVAGTRLLEKLPSSEARFIPFKADGRHVAALYQVDEGWGPGNMMCVKMEKADDGTYWFTLKTRKLLDTLRNEAWKSAYGPAGMLEVGDMLGFLYSTSAAVAINDCRQITVRDCRFFAAKACLDESGGHGGHRWINCHFMARPGTNNLIGGDGTMMNGCQNGATIERCVIQRTSDDPCNNHGYWKHAVAATDRSITFKETPPRGLAAGQTAEAYDRREEKHLGRLTVESADDKTVVFREPVGPKFAAAAVLFPAFQNAGWVIRDTIFCDSYQRVVIGCGPGLFEGNRLERVGAGLTVGNGRPVDIEGGDPHGVVIRGNVFVDSASAPALRAIGVRGVGAPVRGLEISGNLFIGTGAGVLALDNTEGVVVKDNIALRPTVGTGLLKSAKPAAPFSFKRARGGLVSANLVLRPPAAGEVVSLEACDGLRTDRNANAGVAEQEVLARLEPLVKKHATPAQEIIEAAKALKLGR